MRIDKTLDYATKYLRYGETGGYNADSTIVRLMQELQLAKDRLLTKVRMKINAGECARDYYGDCPAYEDVIQFIGNLDGKEIYVSYGKDNSFEYDDNNFWIPDCCFEFV